MDCPKGLRDIDDYTEKYIQGGFEFIQVEYRRKKVLEIIKKEKPSTLLEIGCGMKPLFLDLPDVKTTVIDPSVKFCKNAESLNVAGKHIIINDFFDSNFINKYSPVGFDMIICSGLLHEVGNPSELLNAIHKGCKENTIVHINVPNANSLHRLIAKEAGLIEDIHAMSERNTMFQQNVVFDMRSLEDIVCSSGFEIVEEGSYFVKPFTHWQMQEMINRKIIDAKILDGLDGLTKYIPEFGSEIYVNCKIKNKDYK